MKDNYSKYYKYVGDLEYVDVYRVLDLFEVRDHAQGHAIKKLLLCGSRTGQKPKLEDIKEAKDTLTRLLEMLEERQL